MDPGPGAVTPATPFIMLVARPALSPLVQNLPLQGAHVLSLKENCPCCLNRDTQNCHFHNSPEQPRGTHLHAHRCFWASPWGWEHTGRCCTVLFLFILHHSFHLANSKAGLDRLWPPSPNLGCLTALKHKQTGVLASMKSDLGTLLNPKHSEDCISQPYGWLPLLGDCLQPAKGIRAGHVRGNLPGAEG